MTTTNWKSENQRAGLDIEAPVVILTLVYATFLAGVIALNVGLI